MHGELSTAMDGFYIRTYLQGAIFHKTEADEEHVVGSGETDLEKSKPAGWKRVAECSQKIYAGSVVS